MSIDNNYDPLFLTKLVPHTMSASIGANPINEIKAGILDQSKSIIISRVITKLQNLISATSYAFANNKIIEKYIMIPKMYKQLFSTSMCTRFV